MHDRAQCGGLVVSLVCVGKKINALAREMLIIIKTYRLDKGNHINPSWNCMACSLNPDGGSIFSPFTYLIVSLRIGYLKAVSTSCWQTAVL